jgi:hypothetical protein
MSVSLSNRTLPMLEALYGTDFMSLDEAAHFDQRPFRALLIRKYCAYRPGRGFHITELGRDARRIFLETDIARKNPSMPLTSYFDPVAYGLKPPRKPKPKNNVREFKSQGAA